MVLIVDDEPRSRELLKSMLQLDDYELLEAVSGAEALELAGRHLPDVILLDVMMPEMNGFETCRRLRQDQRLQHVPILFLTALDDRASRLEGLNAGAEDFISKQIDTVELRIRIRTITKLNRFRRLFEERARFEQAVEHAPTGVIVTDHAGRIELINAAAQALFRQAPTVGENAGALFPAGIIEQILHTLAETTTAPPHPHALATRPLAAADRDTAVEITAARLPGRAVYFSLHDITERKRMESQLIRIQRVEVLGQLAGGLAHDLNNVLGSIESSATRLAQETGPGPAPASLINSLQAAAQSGGDMLRQLLLFSRGADEPGEVLDPLPICREVAQLAQEAQGGDIEVRLVVESTKDERARIRSQRSQLHQILLNLIANARDAMDGHGRLSVEFAIRTPHPAELGSIPPERAGVEHVVIAVVDEGPGIAPEVRDRLFEPFFTTKAPGRGTGLGLATVLLLMHRHQGFVTLDSTPGKGARFCCFFPIENDDPPAR